MPLKEWTGFKFVEAPELLDDPVFLNRFTLVFAYYSILVFQEADSTGPKVYVSPETAFDQEFICNLTKKALDTTWLKTHVGPCGL